MYMVVQEIQHNIDKKYLYYTVCMNIARDKKKSYHLVFHRAIIKVDNDTSIRI